ncbi:hypothetical protein KDK95_34475 [Actinospica sp. MGRD01-02]|uniref:Uncharacterized protein n=1 Tax=Actinospica acidithermotolerans TaxID=2828514 RepID=A0A941EEZ9_9ACTN|nr:hypothetical protein [Actinospica acidithermotolerans]MBR7831455.1 hypothetical protein [Actinospica acidithermotolerans]
MVHTVRLVGADVSLIRLHRSGSNPSRWRQEHLEVVLDSSDLFAELCGGCGLPMLERIDPYGSLMLSSAEMDQFVTELSGLRQREKARFSGELFDRIEQLARRCSADSDLQLRIDGD